MPLGGGGVGEVPCSVRLAVLDDPLLMARAFRGWTCSTSDLEVFWLSGVGRAQPLTWRFSGIQGLDVLNL